MVASRFQWAVRFSTRLETDSLVGALGFEPLHLRIGIRPDSGREKSNMRISIEGYRAAPHCQRKFQAMIDPAADLIRNVEVRSKHTESVALEMPRYGAFVQLRLVPSLACSGAADG